MFLENTLMLLIYLLFLLYRSYPRCSPLRTGGGSRLSQTSLTPVLGYKERITKVLFLTQPPLFFA